MGNNNAILLLMALCLISGRAYAQTEGLAPGIYTIVNGQSVPIKHSLGGVIVNNFCTAGAQTCQETFKYNGETSGVEASDIFILVVDPDKTEITKTLKEYDPFVKSMNPNKMRFIPLSVNAEMKRREHFTGATIDRLGFNDDPEMEFEWEKISDNSFEIRVIGLLPGEYAILFHQALTPFDYTRIFGFTIPEQGKNE